MMELPEKLTQQLKRFLRAKKIEGCTVKTLKAYEFELSRFFQFLAKEFKKPSLHDIDRDLVEDWLTESQFQTATRARMLASLKSFCRFLTDRGVLEVNPLESLKTPRVKAKTVSYLTENQFLDLLEKAKTCGPREMPGRDFAIIALFIGSGIRISELKGLDLEDVDLKTKQIKVTRKGGKEQYVPIGDSVITALYEWLEQRQKLAIDEKERAFFVSNRKTRMRGQTIRNAVKKWMKRTGLWGKKMSPHTLRHSYATAQIASGTPVQVVQELLGHNQLNTTSKYLHIVDKERRKAAEKIRF